MQVFWWMFSGYQGKVCPVDRRQTERSGDSNDDEEKHESIPQSIENRSRVCIVPRPAPAHFCTTSAQHFGLEPAATSWYIAID